MQCGAMHYMRYMHEPSTYFKNNQGTAVAMLQWHTTYNLQNGITEAIILVEHFLQVGCRERPGLEVVLQETTPWNF